MVGEVKFLVVEVVVWFPRDEGVLGSGGEGLDVVDFALRLGGKMEEEASGVGLLLLELVMFNRAGVGGTGVLDVFELLLLVWSCVSSASSSSSSKEGKSGKEGKSSS